jgi:hypothetical protein
MTCFVVLLGLRGRFFLMQLDDVIEPFVFWEGMGRRVINRVVLISPRWGLGF